MWIARIMIVWGLVSMAMMFVVGQWSFYAMRVLLGIAEAGFFPGMVLYLTYWVPAAERAKTGALFMTAAPVAVLIGSPVSEALLALDGRLGLAGWQWLFLVEGLSGGGARRHRVVVPDRSARAGRSGSLRRSGSG